MARSRLFQAVRGVLLREWDPIGVRGISAARDEYDSYVPAICRMLESGADEVKLTDHLRRLRTNIMGLSRLNEEHDRRIARRLRGLIEQK